MLMKCDTHVLYYISFQANSHGPTGCCMDSHEYSLQPIITFRLLAGALYGPTRKDFILSVSNMLLKIIRMDHQDLRVIHRGYTYGQDGSTSGADGQAEQVGRKGRWDG